MKLWDPGAFKDKVTLQAPSRPADTDGATLTTFTDVADLKAVIRPLQSRDLFAAQQIHSEITMRLIIHYRTNVRSEYRIKYKNRYLEIMSPPIDVENEHVYLELLCREVVPVGIA